MKQLFVALFFIVQVSIFGQAVEFNSFIFISSEIRVDPEDNSIKDLADFWKSYLLNYNDKKFTDNCWNQIERKQGFTDIVKSAQWMEAVPYTKFTIVDIRKVDNDYYKIQTMFSMQNLQSIYSIFNVYARKESTGYVLYNNLFFSKSTFKHYNIDNVHYYYPENYLFDIQKAKTVTDDYKNIAALYKIDRKYELTYILGNTLHEAYKLIGFDYMVATPASLTAGRHIRDQNIVISCREDHLHEMIHSLFPKGPTLFQEGIATYYGGGNGKTYATFINDLKSDILRQPQIDLSDIDSLDNNLKNGQLNNYYGIGAILIDYALKNGGPRKVLELFQNTDTKCLNDEVALFAKKFRIKLSEFDDLLRKLILDFKTPN